MNDTSASKNILMVAYTNYSTDPRVIREAETLANAGYNVDFLCLKRKADKRHETINGVNVIHLQQERYRGKSNLFYMLAYLEFFFRVLFKSTALFSGKKYPVIHVNNMPDFLVFALAIPKIFGAKIILDIHDPIPSTYQTKFRLSADSFLYKLLIYEETLSAWFADKVITVHEPVKNKVLIPDGIPESKIDVIANFADERKFKLLENVEFSGSINMVFHGTIAERFGFEYVLSELSAVKELPFSLTIIGEGDFSDRLFELIKRFDLSDKVKFDNRFYPVDILPEKLKHFNLGMVSYELSEATEMMLPLKFLEYLSLGLPALCVMNSTLAHYFNNDDAFFFDSRCKGSLSSIISLLAADPALLKEKRKRVENIRKNFYWKTQSEKYVRLIENLVES